MTAYLLALVLALGGFACGDEAPAPSERGSRAGGPDAPPPVTIRYGDESAELEAWTFCYGNGCADGAPPARPHHVGSPEEVAVEFPLEGWTFSATFTPAGDECGRDQRVRLEESDDGSFLLRPAGHAGEYDVTLFGKGDGDLFVTFRWTTPADGPLPEPKARLAVLADHDGAVDSYGVELEVSNLAETPRAPKATITVTAADGDSISFRARRARGRCFPEGTVYWDGPDDEGRAAAQLGEGPFTYDVELVLDGRRHVATATWPDDEIPWYAPSVRLHFEPELPGPS